MKSFLSFSFMSLIFALNSISLTNIGEKKKLTGLGQIKNFEPKLWPLNFFGDHPREACIKLFKCQKFWAANEVKTIAN